jgi:hypothetical protein
MIFGKQAVRERKNREINDSTSQLDPVLDFGITGGELSEHAVLQERVMQSTTILAREFPTSSMVSVHNNP